jgi:hypothetical protein
LGDLSAQKKRERDGKKYFLKFRTEIRNTKKLPSYTLKNSLLSHCFTSRFEKVRRMAYRAFTGALWVNDDVGN